jgi:uncharacterized protein YcbX
MLRYQTEEIFIYPIKSVGPVTLKNIIIGDKGLQYDRHWMLVHTDGRMISQREFPELNKIVCTDGGTFFTLQLCDSSFPEISFDKSNETGEEMNITIWGDHCKAVKTQNILAEWFSEYLSHRVFIVTNPDRKKQLKNFSNTSLMNFQDGSPVHLVNLSSVTDLEKRCGIPLDPMRFRANIYLDFKTAYFEDNIQQIEINGIEFKYIKPCERCIMINLRPHEDVFSKEPLLSLSKYRKEDHKVSFGIYLGLEN